MNQNDFDYGTKELREMRNQKPRPQDPGDSWLARCLRLVCSACLLLICFLGRLATALFDLCKRRKK